LLTAGLKYENGPVFPPKALSLGFNNEPYGLKRRVIREKDISAQEETAQKGARLPQEDV